MVLFILLRPLVVYFFLNFFHMMLSTGLFYFRDKENSDLMRDTMTSLLSELQ